MDRQECHDLLMEASKTAADAAAFTERLAKAVLRLPEHAFGELADVFEGELDQLQTNVKEGSQGGPF